MSEQIERRKFLARLWKWGFGIMAGAAAWTSWDFLQPVAGQAGGPVAFFQTQALQASGQP
jgi:hypothetical protein